MARTLEEMLGSISKISKYGSSIDLYFKKDCEEEEILKAIEQSLCNFYATEFKDELIDSKVEGSEGYYMYDVESHKQEIRDVKKWSYHLFGDFLYKNKKREKRLLGYINIFKKPDYYTINFCIRDMDIEYIWEFRPHKETNRKHIKKYRKFIITKT